MSNSIRVASDLFEAASAASALMTRSAAQQIEHWARLGQALEVQGLPLNSALQLLAAQTHSVQEPAALWQYKRQAQRSERDELQTALQAGKPARRRASLFSGTQAAHAKVLNGPF